MSKLVKFLSWPYPLEPWSEHFPVQLHRPWGGGVVIKDPSVWLDGARPLSEYVFKNQPICDFFKVAVPGNTAA